MSQQLWRVAVPVVLGGLAVPSMFALAATSTPAADVQQLIVQLQQQIQALQAQVKELRTQLESVKTELTFTHALQRGATGEEVKQLQEFLAKSHPDLYPEGLITGYFGPLTEQAIKRLQEKHGIEPEGIVGPKTRAKLNELLTEGAGSSGNIPPGLLTAPGLHQPATGTPTVPPPSATTAIPAVPGAATTTQPAPPSSPLSATSTPSAPPPPPSPPSATTTPPTSATPPPSTTTVSGQTAPLWVRMLGSTDNDRALAIAADRNGYSYVAGYVSASLDGQPYRGGYDAFVAKYDPNGSRLWTRELGSTRSGVGSAFADAWTAAAVDSSGNVYLAGWSYGSFDGQPFSDNTDAILAKYDSNGTKLWVREFGSTLNDQLYGIAVDAAGNIYAAGLTDTSLDGQASAGLMDALVVKYDTNGTKLWTRLLGTSSYDRANAMALDYGVVYVGGWTRGPLGGETYSGNGSEDAFLTAYDPNGTRLWTRLLGGPGSEVAYGVSVGSAHAVYIAGQTSSSLGGQSNAGGLDAMTARYDATLQSLSWARQFGSSDQDNAYGVAADAGLNSYLTGSISGGLDGQVNAGGTDAFVVEYDGNGNRIWTRLLGTATSDTSQAVALDGSGNVFIAGGSWGSLGGQVNAGLEDVFLAKYNLSQTTSIPPPSSISPPPPPASSPPPAVLPPASATSTAPSPAPAPAPPPSATPSIKTGSGTVGSSQNFTLPMGTWYYSGALYGSSGYLYNGAAYSVTPPVAFANVTPSGPDACSSGYVSDAQGIANICQFTSAANYVFSQPTFLRIYDKGSSCSQGIVPFRQGSYYGAIEPTDIDASGALHYTYWYDESGGSNFSSVCSTATTPPPPPPPSTTATTTQSTPPPPPPPSSPQISQVQGLSAVVSGTSVTLSWQAATASAGGNIVYNLYLGTTSDFTPDPLINFAATTGLSYTHYNYLSPGTYYYRVAAKDINGIIGPMSQPASAVISVLRVMTPNGGEQWVKGSSYQVQWSNPLSAGFSGDPNFTWNINLDRVVDTGWYLTSVPVAQSSYTWTIPSFMPDTGSNYKIRIFLARGCFTTPCPEVSTVLPSGSSDSSDGTFTITAPASATTTSAAAPSNLAAILDAIARVLAALGQEIKSLR